MVRSYLLLLLCGLVGACTAATTTTTPAAATSTTAPAPAVATPTAATPTAATATTTATTATTAATTAWFPQAGGPRDLVLVYTASVQGYVEPCGCTGDPLGGLARLGALLHEARAAYGERVLFVDGGDLLFEKLDDDSAADRCQAEARTDLLLGTYARLGLAATTRGPLDDVRGAAFRAALLRKHGVPSLDDGQGLVVQRGELRALVVGAAADDDLAVVQRTVDAHAPGSAAAVDLVVVLLQGTHAQAKAHARLWRGVDVVVVGRAAEGPVAPERVGTTVVVSAGWQAQRAGVVVVRLQGRGRDVAPWAPLALDDRVATVTARQQLLDVRLAGLDERLATLPPGDTRAFQQARRDAFAAERDALSVAALPPPSGPHVEAFALALRRGSPEEPVAARDLQAYLRSIPALVGACERDVVCPPPAAGTAAYVGAATCRACHAAAYAQWERAVVSLLHTAADGTQALRPVGHAKAWTTLVELGRDRDRGCVGCHAAGFAADGGACTTTQLVQRGLVGVQCESCHGPGSLHVAGGGDKTKIRRAVDETTCRSCHLPPHIESVASFVYDDRLRLILGEGHGEERLRSLSTSSMSPPPASAGAAPQGASP